MRNNVNIVGDCNKDLKVTTYTDWVKIHFSKSEVSMADLELKETEIVENIICLQVSYFLLRRASHLCQSVSDNIWDQINQQKKKYKKLMGSDFVDYNKETDY